MTRDGYDRAMNYIGIWLALKSVNRRLYKHLEAEAEIGGQEWRARVDALVETVSRDLAPMGRFITLPRYAIGSRLGCANRLACPPSSASKKRIGAGGNGKSERWWRAISRISR
jgi:hypothetical protein